MKEYIFPLPEGVAKIEIPDSLSATSEKAIADWLILTVRSRCTEALHVRRIGKSVFWQPRNTLKPDTLSGTIFGCKHCGHKLMAESWRRLTKINEMCPKCNTEQVSNFKVVSCPAKLTTNKVPRETKPTQESDRDDVFNCPLCSYGIIRAVWETLVEVEKPCPGCKQGAAKDFLLNPFKGST